MAERRIYSAEEKAAFVESLRKKTQCAALEVIRLFQSLPRTEESRILGRQLMRSATSVAANYRAVCRACSPQEQFAKLSICVEEADETIFWLEMLRESEISAPESTLPLELRYLEFVSILAKARRNSKPH